MHGIQSAPMVIHKHHPLKNLNSFGIVATAEKLLRIRDLADLDALYKNPVLAAQPKHILGAGCNTIFAGNVSKLVLKIDIQGRRLHSETDTHYIVEAGAGEDWHELVCWTVKNGWLGLENLALIPGSVGAAPVQNIGAYGVELQNVLFELNAFNLIDGTHFTLPQSACAFAYRDSIFKHTGEMGLKDKAVITKVRLALPKNWTPQLNYKDFERHGVADTLINKTPQQQAQIILDAVCAIRQSKLPDPSHTGNAGSFFKNPIVDETTCRDILEREPHVVHYPLGDGTYKLAAGWLIDACGWKGKSIGNAGVYDKQALVLINRERQTQLSASGGEVMLLAQSIQTSVYERFGIRLEPEPVIV